MGFSGTDAAFEGFRLARHHPKAIGIWALTALVFNFAVMALMVRISGPAMAEITAASQSGMAPDPAQHMAAVGSMAVAYLFVAPLTLLLLSIFGAAVYRASTRPEASAFGFVRLGADEIRLLVVNLVVGVMGIVVLIGLTFCVALVGGIITAVLSGGQPNMAGTAVTVLLLYAVMILAGMAFYAKFSFAGPMTFLSKRVSIFGSWRATSGHFWALCGCYTLAVVLGIVVALLGMVIGLAAVLLAGGTIASIFRPDMSSLSAYFTVGTIAYLAVNSIFTGLTYAIYQGPAMAAYLAIHGTGANDVPQTPA